MVVEETRNWCDDCNRLTLVLSSDQDQSFLCTHCGARPRGVSPAVVDGAVDAYQRFGILLWKATRPAWEHLDGTTAQLKCVVVLEARGALPICGLGNILGMNSPAISITVDQLVRRGLVSRTEDPQDRRRTNASLTPAGRDFIQRLHRGDETFLRSCFERLDQDDLIALRTGLVALTQAMSGADEEPALLPE